MRRRHVREHTDDRGRDTLRGSARCNHVPYNSRSPVYRKGKWALGLSEYPFHYFPPYESGSGYLISADLLRPLRNASDFVPYIFIDDVYVTGILGRVVGARHVTRPGFAYWTNRAPSACAILNGSVLTGTRVTGERQRQIWNELVSRDTYCDPVTRVGPTGAGPQQKSPGPRQK